MKRDELERIANSGGYGSGKAARDRLAAEAEALRLLPEPMGIPPVIAATNHAFMLLLAHFGNSNEDGKDWSLYHDGREADVWCFGDDAKADALAVAAIINAYRLGIIVRA